MLTVKDATIQTINDTLDHLQKCEKDANEAGRWLADSLLLVIKAGVLPNLESTLISLEYKRYQEMRQVEQEARKAYKAALLAYKQETGYSVPCQQSRHEKCPLNLSCPCPCHKPPKE